MRNVGLMRTAAVAALLLPAATVVLLRPSAGAQKATGVVVFAAGDIASCASNGDEQTAALVAERLPRTRATVLTLGDNAYKKGTTARVCTLLCTLMGQVQGSHETDGREPRLHDSRRQGLSRVL